MQCKFQRLLTLLLALWFAPTMASSLRVVMEVSPPHQTNEQGVPGGLTTAVVQEMLAAARLTPTIEVYPWARAFKIASTTPNALIYNMARTSARENKFIWIGEVARYRFGFVKLKKRVDIQIRQLSEAKRYVAGAQRDDFSADWLSDQGFLLDKQLILLADIEETWRYLVSGKIDILIDDPFVVDMMLVKFQLTQSDIEFVYYLPELQQTTWIAMHKNSDPELVTKLKMAYEQVRQGEAFKQVMQFGELPVPVN